jgi:hypothetical protein
MSLHVDGYQVVRKVFTPTPLFLNYVKRQSSRHSVEIFNGQRGKRNDLRRRQTPLDLRVRCVKSALTKIEAEIRTRGLVGGAADYNSWVIVESLKGCARQRYHTDYDLAKLAALTDEEMPLGVIVVLETKTTLHVIPKSIHGAGEQYPPIVIQATPGDVICFRGDLVHAGSDYPSRSNIRMHAYVHSPQFRRLDNATYLQDT